MKIVSTVTLGAVLLACSVAGSAQSTGPAYKAADLLSPCQTADNDSRWGAAAETECEQYILGYVHALAKVGASGPGKEVCPPAVNTADEVRWAFMRWVHGAYTARGAMTAPDALMETLKASFPCK